MKVSELIRKLENGRVANSEAEVVVYSDKLEGYTADLGISYDDKGDIEIYILAGAEVY